MVFTSRIAVALFTSQIGYASASIRGTRRLDRPSLGPYEPASTVTDHAAIDQDQAALESQLSQAVPSFQGAKYIYEQGAHSKPYANLKLSTATTSAIAKNAGIEGLTSSGEPVTGVVYDDVGKGVTTIKVKYATSENAASPTLCRVGGLPEAGVEPTVTGCFADAGTITIIGYGDFSYTYDSRVDNGNGRTLQGFSLQAEKKMRTWTEYQKFQKYWGDYDFGDKWVQNALAGTKYRSQTGKEYDFGLYGDEGRKEAVKKGTVFMNVYQYVLHEFEDAIADCNSDCVAGVDCNEEQVHAWDEGVAFYTGSLEEKLLYKLANKRCQNYKTCGPRGSEQLGNSKVNYELFNEFLSGRDLLLAGECGPTRAILQRITELMAVPLVQGALRYAYKVGELKEGEKEQAEGTVFMASVIPRVHDCDAGAAEIIADNMAIREDSSTDFAAVKAAFESQYECMGIKCTDVGGLLQGTNYYPDFQPCDDNERMGIMAAGASTVITKSNPIGTIIGIVFAVVAVCAIAFILFMRKKEKEGAPIFVTKVVDVQ
uniref:Uncharacterized protein n=3 Tax=Corethron hystrix TaxID=216773 RepID=A0A7S1G0P6_9STRA|mmetsp:Transcript_43359/g.101727  ORF Transcript_43359/g.101727 Transcript_43359/m.101727 type:complete len:541 (+) Transcript_43359:145-1767(+)|eukprot:CAMPEP_0113312872 /NCGR_PEP_ID=MMETSP0010_2-20120614/9531_1 /TAXON_ID=216773 ORGANISM="Corethron hystrix, Strain 308" /NCGR_SAMPLE_ID=MMETSP0010_2 /ASSEMBLY_ACC=CAM_ASM_000155 /LENGTH=540 /DNA_ID=CAMNT_0000168789 /DNA_START=122 /DNA_END=1744 /DNA_ORIENTATION=+ /assembly_acc=CAM_ASM_000155